MNVKFHKNCENTGKILKISCIRCNFVKFDMYFLGFPIRNFLWCYYRRLITSLALEKCKKGCNVLVQGFCPLKIKITQFPSGFRLKV